MAEVAIVGMGAVFPGAGDAPSFWRNIRSGTDAISDVPPDRWDPAVYCDPGEAGDDRFYCRRGGFLADLAEFDPAPFGIMPAAVDGTEPDQLLVLRAAAEAIADGGALPDRERVGVIIGRGGYLTPGVARLDQRVSTVHQLIAALSDLVPDLGGARLDAVRAAFAQRLGPGGPDSSIGLVPNFAASRIANRFDLRGPAYTVDAACASALVAVDHAVSELASGRCDAVLAGGVHTCHHPTLWTVFTRLRALSSGGTIRPFDASADGTLLSEGAGVVLLKRLADARDAGDRIYAVISGVGIASDGRATSMMNPLADGQELAIRRAWAAADLDPEAPDALGLLEAHGTATPVGDNVELTVIGRVFGPPRGRPIGLGTVKSMIGHAMPAAGIAGLIKAAFAVHDGVLPPTLHVDEPNPALAATRFEPVSQARDWDDAAVRRAAVNAFGFGGINAHVILQASDAAGQRAGRPRRPQPHGVPDEVVLRLATDTAAQLAARLSAPDSSLLERAGEQPGDGQCRLAIVAPDAGRLALARKVVARATPWRGRNDIWFSPDPLLRGPGQVAFLFPGFEPEFTPRMEGVAEAFGLPVPELRGGSAFGQAMSGTDGVVEYALDVIAVSRLFAAALNELGITPGVLAGHSMGEWTAMIVGGFFPEIDEFIASMRPGLVDVPDVVYLALGAGAGRAAELIGGLAGVALTHDNCQRQSVVCGPAALIDKVAQRAREAGILARALPFRTGFHSPMYGPYVPAARQTLRRLDIRGPQVPTWSATSLAEFPCDPDGVRDLVLRHLVEPVRFRQLTQRLHESGIRAFVQVGPGSLTGFVDDTLGDREHLAVATAVPQRDGLAQLRRAAAALWADGLSPRFDRLRSSRVRLKLGGSVVRLAGAVEPVTAAGARGAADDRSGTDGLAGLPGGKPVLAEFSALLAEATGAAESVLAAMEPPARSVPGGAVTLEREFSLRTMPDIVDHCIFPQPDGWPDDSDRFPVVPMTTLLEIMADAALAALPGRVVIGFQQVRAMRWLAVAPPTTTAIRAAPDGAGPGGADRVRVSIEGYASGYVLLSGHYPAPPPSAGTPLRDARQAPVTARELYADGWMFHGPRFAGVADIGLLAADGITGTVLSMAARGALLDSAGQLIGHWMQVSRTVDQTVLPTGIGTVRQYGPQPPVGQPLDCTAWIREITDTEMRADAELRTRDGRVWCRIAGWTTRRFASDDAIWRMKSHPERNTLSQLAPGGWNVVRERWPDAASRELMMRRYLNSAERAQYALLNPLQQRRWLLGRIAVKDAVRRLLWERGAGPVYPAELTVADAGTGTGTGTDTDTEAGARVRGPFLSPPVSLALSRPDSPGRPCAVAIAGDEHAGFTIETDDDGTVLIAEPGRAVLPLNADA